MRIFQFVDSVAANPTVRLDLNSWASGLMVGDEGLDLSPPPVRRTVVESQLDDGGHIPDWVYGNRTITLPLQLVDRPTVDSAAGVLQALGRELARDGNLLLVQMGTVPVFFETFAAPDYAWRMTRLLAEHGRAVVEIPTRPHGIGLEETIGPYTVYNDPAEGTDLNTNPYFETEAAGWTATGGSVARSTAQFHEGAASLLMTPDGVTASAVARNTVVTASVGQVWRASAWLRCAAARSVSLNIDWRTAGGTLISQTSNTISVSADTWTLFDVTGTAPATTGQAGITVSMGSTPPASHLLYIDQARLRRSGGNGALCFDVTGVKGDVSTPLLLRLANANVLDSELSLLAARRRGDPSAMTFYFQCEDGSMGAGTAGDTSAQPNDAAMSGTGTNNFARTTFASQTVMFQRILFSMPAAATVEARGRYRVLARLRRSNDTDVIRVKLQWGTLGDVVAGPVVTVPATTDRRWVDFGCTVALPFHADPVWWGASGVAVPVGSGSVSFELLAQRVSGSGTLDWDVVAFVPADDWQCMIRWAGGALTEWIVDGVQQTVWSRDFAGNLEAAKRTQVQSGWPKVSPGATNRVWFMVNGGADSPTNDSISAQQTVTGSYWPRYLMLPTGA